MANDPYKTHVLRSLAHHPPSNEYVVTAHERTRTAFTAITAWLIDNVPASEERNNAINSIREALMWANASIALNQGAVPMPDEIFNRDPIKSDGPVETRHMNSDEAIEFFARTQGEPLHSPDQELDYLLAEEEWIDHYANWPLNWKPGQRIRGWLCKMSDGSVVKLDGAVTNVGPQGWTVVCENNGPIWFIDRAAFAQGRLVHG